MSSEKPNTATTQPAIHEGRWLKFPSKRSMTLGLQLPQNHPRAKDQLGQGENGWSNGEGFWDIVAKAKLALAVGFDMLWLPDHMVIDLDSDPGVIRGIWDCWTTLAGLAAALPGVPIGTMVACTGFHNPGSIAKMAESVDAISQGNLVLGLGCGWHKPEYDMFGFPFDHRVDRFAEALPIIASLTRTGCASFDGAYYQARDAVNFPRGPRWREGGPPILLGAKQPRMMQLTALYADAWNADWLLDPELFTPMMADLDDACRSVGREPSSLVRTSSCRYAMAEDTGEPWPAFHGTPAEMAATMVRFAELGSRHHVISTDPRTPGSLEKFGTVIELFDRG
ncbi:MAG: LLM class flavin-dependent oxidoreductase [Chloroflexota bacterium]|nr:LLM class flavin-dependent oxidoreductase [Chloroflexota bacterium]